MKYPPLKLKITWKDESPLLYRIIDWFRIAIRRNYYLRFRKKYVQESIKNRKGQCKHQGCCNHSLLKCSAICGKDCKLWKDLPEMCKIYPLDEKDKSWWSKKNCGFYWEKK